MAWLMGKTSNLYSKLSNIYGSLFGTYLFYNIKIQCTEFNY